MSGLPVIDQGSDGSARHSGGPGGRVPSAAGGTAPLLAFTCPGCGAEIGLGNPVHNEGGGQWRCEACHPRPVGRDYGPIPDVSPEPMTREEAAEVCFDEGIVRKAGALPLTPPRDRGPSDSPVLSADTSGAPVSADAAIAEAAICRPRSGTFAYMNDAGYLVDAGGQRLGDTLHREAPPIAVSAMASACGDRGLPAESARSNGGSGGTSSPGRRRQSLPYRAGPVQLAGMSAAAALLHAVVICMLCVAFALSGRQLEQRQAREEAKRMGTVVQRCAVHHGALTTDPVATIDGAPIVTANLNPEDY